MSKALKEWDKREN